ncbi:MAG TPA: hypothetical protein PLE48_08015 [Thiobacillus sp.]|nr:MAG: hypothetical protein B7Y50_03890 [Hydrogenophilales bacterium 28-61-11]OYZ57708.1 MAG: hypothetical protein B7Y21_06515 [Hydrogenophilales bacterium 16-61-112]OZA42894.1 MAG: hypothetical protein B7X81_12190 [Hydrogenophilales bacterium 17-61-76]HQT70356.1 hypothetical protein [Thiobacillus sp.]
MPKRQKRSPEVSALIAEILLAGKSMTPPITAGEMALRAGISPETLSRMKRYGRGDMAVINDLAAIAGLQLKLSRGDGAREKLMAGAFFDD